MADAGQGNSGGWPMIDRVEVKVTPDDGAPRALHSLQVPGNAKLRLSWTARNAKSVRIDGLGNFGASGSADLPTQDASYKLVAVGEGGVESLPFPLDIHTHEPGEVFSQHIQIAPPKRRWLIDFGIHHNG
jgi:hypothetical protein